MVNQVITLIVHVVFLVATTIYMIDNAYLLNKKITEKDTTFLLMQVMNIMINVTLWHYVFYGHFDETYRFLF